jgi:hypothetical protein
MNTANEHSDECPASLAAYSDSIAEIDLIVASLTSRRALLVRRLQNGASSILPFLTINVRRE